ncbi:MAG: PAS domain-containing protein [Burkholderiaceae bacterium]
MAERIERHDWAGTPLGPRAQWPQSLKTSVDIMLGSSCAMQLAWGPERTLLYNDAYVPILGRRDSDALGRPLRSAWPDIWHDLEPLVDRALAGVSAQVRELPLVTTRSGDAEQTWWDFSCAPVRDESGAIAGLLMVTVDGASKLRADRTEQALRETERRLRHVLDGMGEAFGLMDHDLRIITQNEAALRLDGRSLAEIRGRAHAEVYPEADPELERLYRRALAEQQPVSLEHRHRWPDRDACWLEMRAYPVPDGLAVFWRDITERKEAEEVLSQSEERQAFLLRLSDALHSLGDPVAVQATSCGILASHLGVDRVQYIASDLNGGSIQRGRAPADDDLSGQLVEQDPNLEPLHLPIWRMNRAVAIDDAETDPALSDEERAVLTRRGVKAALSSPLVRDGSVVAVIIALSDTPRAWSQRDIELLEETVDRTWTAVERARTEAALRESEQRFREFGDTSSDAIWIVDAESMRLEYLSPAFERIWGESRARVMEDLSRWAEMLHPDDRADAAAAMPRMLAGEAVVSEYRIIRPDGEVRWIRDTGFPIRQGGSIKRGGGIAQDITELKRAGRALRASEQRLRQFGDASQDVLWIRDAETLQWQYLTPAFEEIYGLTREAALTGNNYQSWLDLVVPSDRERVSRTIERVCAGEHVSFDYRIRRPVDGRVRWLRDTDFPIVDGSGKITLIGGIGHDLTELREAELRLDTLVQGIPQLVWRAIDGGHWTWASTQWSEFTGQTMTDCVGEGWLDALHPDDQPVARRNWSRAIEAGSFDIECRIRNASNHEYRWFQMRATPVRDETGSIIEWLGTSTDIHELRALQERQSLLVSELQHRTRNIMSVVISLVDRVGESSTGSEDFRDRLSDRLRTLARVQGLLSRLDKAERVSFDELIRAELEAMHGASDRVRLDGPSGVRLRSSLVQTLAMALHELATNAVKYGALGQRDAQLMVSWRMVSPDRRGRPRLHIEWRESGVAMPPEDATPRGGGQGRELIEQALPYQLGAETTFVLEPDGLHCTMTIPVSATNPTTPAPG